MPIITPPKIVQNALDEFIAPLLNNDPQRKHLANYVTGLMISDNKTVAGMTAEMPNASDQSCLNPYLTYRGRWTGTETFHRDGKQELGLGDCQLRDGTGQTRHIYCVFLAHSQF